MHIPKTAGVSLHGICRHHGIQILNHNTRDPNFVSLARYKQHYPGRYAFTVVRNPWDRVVSSYFYLKKGGDRAEDQQDAEKHLPFDDFRSFVLKGFDSGGILEQIHFRPQYQWVEGEKGIIVNRVALFENLQAGLSRIFGDLGLPGYQLPHHNKSKHQNYRTYYDQETWDIVGRVYHKDVKLFQYSNLFQVPK